MLSPPPRSTSIPGYNFSAPTEADARAALQRVFGPDRGADRWSEACRAAGLVAGRVDSSAELQRAVLALAGQGGPTAVVARSIEIRMRTYARLAASSATRAGGQE